MEQRRNEGAGETRDPREDPPTNVIVRHDSHMQEYGVTRPPGIEPGSPWWEESRLTTQPPWTPFPLLASNHGKPGSIPGLVTPGFSQVGIVPDDAAGLRVFSEISPPP
ncbi:hypothetical protein PR048_031446 [Dryococelus australis]|uniref:Uncharacterized protein n=1 Tax=Dryococelus australis TaxID=614101 RepID=A0ABQ9G8B8_9NEOP|nr:hypothetical protein PR048_031446 [Dryococelus australis]